MAQAATRQRGIALPGGLDSLGRIGNVVADEPISLQELRVRDVKVFFCITSDSVYSFRAAIFDAIGPQPLRY